MSGVAAVVAVAASGGRDSTALLHAAARAAQDQGVEVVALHVHHGLNPAADHWQQHLQRQCARWARAGLPVRFSATRLAGAPAQGESIEAWARRGRYAALAQMAREAGAHVILLAHHRRDQAETLLLQALRGAGPTGLAAMPREAERDGLLWCRPWLDTPAAAIAAYITRHRLTHIDDDSNQDTRFDRNRLRHDVWPALLGAFPQAEAALTQAARLSQQAAALVHEVASADLAALQDGPDAGINVTAWMALSKARQAAVLRHWLRPMVEEGVRETLIERLLAELPRARSARWPAAAASELRLYRGHLTLAGLAPSTVSPDPAPVRLDEPGRIELPAWGGTLELATVEQGGASRSLLARAGLRERQPGDQFQLAPRSTARNLKKQFQALGIPAWQRNGPIVATADQVLFVPGLGIDARALAAAGEPQLALRWEPVT
ncbi:MAG TPA: tRNA lysidine(34) synthetase TilS [Ideonella sp.]|uniref:tRNA lysidine(34) synthetase TilS n=1 Tax=Ideonella sp. TaxID=1929293 RepID=UPI002E30CCA0|nr:tRNA lysidine(34) synthetase TilS [Ideonella sp.]HEX5686312.1 tRNA lysidine(34) synthetase TilS [Ideonella sp.]